MRVRALTQHPVGQTRDRAQQVLAVVEDDQHPPRPQRLDDAVLQRDPGTGPHAQRPGDHLEHRLGVVGRRQLTDPRAVREARDQVRRDLQRETRLPDATHPDQRHQPRRLQRLAQRRQLLAATHERRHLQRQIPGERVQRPQRSKVRHQARRPHLEDPLRDREIGQPMLAQVDELDRSVAHQRGRHRRHDDLLTMGDAHQARGAIDLTAVVVAVPVLSLAGVHTHPHTQWARLRE